MWCVEIFFVNFVPKCEWVDVQTLTIQRLSPYDALVHRSLEVLSKVVTFRNVGLSGEGVTYPYKRI